MALCKKPSEDIMEKIQVTSIFILSHNVFTLPKTEIIIISVFGKVETLWDKMNMLVYTFSQTSPGFYVTSVEVF